MPKVLLAANSEFGQANVFLAAGHALQALDADVQIHFVSFATIQPHVSAASEYSVRCAQGAQPWTFHELQGPSFFDAVYARAKDNGLGATLAKRPGFSTTLELLSKQMCLMLPWDAPGFVRVYQSFVGLVDQIRPDIVAVDSLFSPVLTACRHLDLKHLILSPNTLKDFSAALQPWAALLWKYPVMGSALPFPIPWKLIPANVLLALCQIWYALTDRTLRAVARQVKRDLGVAELITMETLMMRPPPRDHRLLVANRPEIEFPLAVVPPHLTPCGPLVRPVPPVSEVDPELAAWLRRGPTVFVCLGTLMFMTEEEALEMAGALRLLLEAADDGPGGAEEEEEGGGGGGIGGVKGKLQVLWKLKKIEEGPDYGTGPGSRIYNVLGEALALDRARIVDWVRPQPSAVLQTPTVVCSVNHGGANSFHDALTSGIPQVCLPCWLDCYDFGSRAEFLGIGRWGNKQAMPRCAARELGPVLVDVVLGPKAESIRARVRELAALCAESPGASVAAAAILQEMDGKKEK